VHLVSDFKPINPTAMQGVTASKQAAGAYIIPDSFQPLSQLLSLFRILDTDKAWGCEFHGSFINDIPTTQPSALPSFAASTTAFGILGTSTT
jgi:hypothetical protein